MGRVLGGVYRVLENKRVGKNFTVNLAIYYIGRYNNPLLPIVKTGGEGCFLYSFLLFLYREVNTALKF